MDLSTVLFILLGGCLVCAVAGGAVAKEKNRDAVEGVIFGAIFGPIGVVITALLPTKPTSDGSGQAALGTIGQGKTRSLDDRGQIAYLENRYRDILGRSRIRLAECIIPPSKSHPAAEHNKRLMKELKLSPTRFDELSIEAMRPILNNDPTLS